MAVGETIEARQFPNCGVIVPPVLEPLVLAPVEALFLAHETVWVLGYLLANSRMLLQILLQCGVFRNEFLVLHQRGVSAQLFGDFTVAVHEAIETCQLPTRGVVVLPNVIATVAAT